ncbi:MAG: hypothetical protein Q9160_004151 [Pyrenula sp. 1 TL-2023]
MPCLGNLATELVLSIFESLEHLDDAYHLARCCKRFNQIYEGQRLSILASIIVYSKAHRFDKLLSNAITVNQDWCVQDSHYTDLSIDLRMHDDCRRGVRRRLKELLDPKPERQPGHRPSDRALPELILWDIVARWGAMQALGHLYLDSGVKEKFCTFKIQWPFEANNFNFASPGDIGLGPCHTRARAATRPMDAHNNARLYTAVSALWLLQELEMAALTAYWETSTDLRSTRSQLANTVQILITSVTEALDLVEATDFLLSFCLERLFAGCANSLTWLRGTLWQHPSYIARNGLLPENARGVLQRILRPSDILELVLLSTHSPDLPSLNKQRYLYARGIFDYTQGTDGYCIGDGPYRAPSRRWGFTLEFGENVLQSLLKALYAPGLVGMHPRKGPNIILTRDQTSVFPDWTNEQHLWAGLEYAVGDSWMSYRNKNWTKELKGRLFVSPPMSQEEVGEGILRRHVRGWVLEVMDRANLGRYQALNDEDEIT